MPLEQTLQELEPILPEGAGDFQVAHPSFQDVLTAKQFADEANSQNVAFNELYQQFWPSCMEQRRIYLNLYSIWIYAIPFFSPMSVQQLYNCQVQDQYFSKTVSDMEYRDKQNEWQSSWLQSHDGLAIDEGWGFADGDDLVWNGIFVPSHADIFAYHVARTMLHRSSVLPACEEFVHLYERYVKEYEEYIKKQHGKS